MLKLKAQNYINKFTQQHGIRSEVPIGETIYIVDLADVMTGYGIFPEAAYWRKGVKECDILGRFKNVSPECLKEAIEIIIYGITKKNESIEIEVDEKWDIK